MDRKIRLSDSQEARLAGVARDARIDAFVAKLVAAAPELFADCTRAQARDRVAKLMGSADGLGLTDDRSALMFMLAGLRGEGAEILETAGQRAQETGAPVSVAVHEQLLKHYAAKCGLDQVNAEQ